MGKPFCVVLKSEDESSSFWFVTIVECSLVFAIGSLVFVLGTVRVVFACIPASFRFDVTRQSHTYVVQFAHGY
jgi:hypothetical protein